jgi:hypothetical protein
MLETALQCTETQAAEFPYRLSRVGLVPWQEGSAILLGKRSQITIQAALFRT